MSILLLIVGIMLFIGLVVTHEYGHFIAAKRNGVEVEEFSIFFPPTLYKRKTKGGWQFSIGALPLGGFVRLKGEHDSDTEPGSFGAASLLAKTKIMLAGVTVNLITALVLLTLLGLVGLPELVPNQFTIKRDTHAKTYMSNADDLISSVEPHSPAQLAGVRSGDRLVGIGRPGHIQKIVNPDDLPKLTKQYAGQQVVLKVERGKRQLILQTRLLTAQERRTDKQRGYLGVVTTPEFSQLTLLRSTWSAPLTAVGLSAQITVLTFQGLGHALTGLGSLIAGAVTHNTVARQHGQVAATSQITGPVGIFLIMKNGSLLGYQFMLFIVAIVALALAVMNVLPIPALDGGRLWLMLLTRAIKRPLSQRREEAINAAGFVLIMVLAILVTINDLHRA